MLQAILSDDYIEDKAEVEKQITPIIEDAISDAQAEIDGYLAKRYSVPFTEVPPVISKFTKDMAVYNLASRIGIDEQDREKTILTRYNAAVSFLTKVAQGTIELNVSEGQPQKAANTGFHITANQRIFRRNDLRGW